MNISERGADPRSRPAARGINLVLILVSLGLLLPAWITIGAMAWRMAEATRAEIARDGIDAARRAATSIEHEFNGLRAALLTLSAAPGIDAAALEAQATTLGALLGIGLQVEAREAAAPEREVVIGRLEQAPVTRHLVLPLSIALPGTPPRQLVLRAEAAGFWSEAVRRAALPDGWPVIVLDAEGRILTRLPVSDRIGSLIGAQNRFLVNGPAQGRQRTLGVSGTMYDVAWQRLPATGWTVAVAVPAQAADDALFDAVWPLLVGAAVLGLLVPLGVWFWGARWIVRPLAALADQAAAPMEDAAARDPTLSGIREIDDVAEVLRVSALERSRRHAIITTSEAALRRLLDNLPVGVVLVEAPSGKVLYLNAAMAAIRGRPIEVGGHVTIDSGDWIALDAEGKALPAADLPLSRAMRTGKPTIGDYRLRRDDGRLLWLRSMAAPMRAPDSDAVTGAVCVLVEVGDEYAAVRALGEQVEAEAAARRDALAAAVALAASEERFRHFAEASPDALWIHDRRWAAPIYVGPAAAAMSGLPAERLAADPDAWIAAILPEDRALLRDAMAEAAAGRQAAAEYRLRRADGAVIWIRDIVFPIGGAQRHGEGAGPPRIGRLARNATSRKDAEARQSLLIAELNHRVKNTLATVQSIAMQTARGVTAAEAGPETFLPAFTARLRALAQGHDLLTASTWTGAPLDSLITTVLAPWRGGVPPRVTVAGPPLWLGPRQALALALALHELATNAAKHGALSLEGDGQAQLTWESLPEGGARMVWCESGGPPVCPPRRQGFGSRLLGRGLAAELGPGATVDLLYEVEGLRAIITFPPPPTTTEAGSAVDVS